MNSNQGVLYPLNDNQIYRNAFKDALLDIRLSLSTRKIMTGLFISRMDFKTIVDDVRERCENLRVKKAIDNLFDEYFVNIKQNNNEVQDNLMNYSEGEAKGTSLVKRTSFFKNSDKQEDK